MTRTLAAALLLAGPAAAGDDPEHARCLERAMTSAAMAACGHARIKRLDAVLNERWSALQAALSPEAWRALRSEQRRWLTFLESACRFWSASQFGSMHRSLAAPECRAGIIEARIAQLEAIAAWLQEPPEQPN
jgi:uncharacterized protein YecT (DUF1311 family)